MTAEPKMTLSPADAEALSDLIAALGDQVIAFGRARNLAVTPTLATAAGVFAGVMLALAIPPSAASADKIKDLLALWHGHSPAVIKVALSQLGLDAEVDFRATSGVVPAGPGTVQ